MQHLELAKRTLSNIQARPDTFHMGTWGRSAPASFFVLHPRSPRRLLACLAGHTLLAEGFELMFYGSYIRGKESVAPNYVPVVARELLGLTEQEYRTTYQGHHHSPSCNLFCGAAGNQEALDAFEAIIQAEEARRVPPVKHRSFRERILARL